VVLRGLKIGEVTDITLELDVASLDVRIPVRIEVQPQRVTPVGGSAGTMTPYQRMEKLVAHGARAQLRSGSLLTGQLVVALDFFPDAPAAKVAYEQDIAVIPSVPSDIEQFTEKAKAFLDKLQKAPVAELVADLRRTVQDADRLLASPSLQQSVRELGPLIAGLNKTVAVAQGTLTQADTTLQTAGDALGPDSALRYDLALLLQELTETARSLRVLVDYLEREPNAVLFGKKPQGK
jgi:paraquat-inducible protein B